MYRTKVFNVFRCSLVQIVLWCDLMSNSMSRCSGSSIVRRSVMTWLAALKLRSVFFCGAGIAGTLLAIADSFGKRTAWSFQKCNGVICLHNQMTCDRMCPVHPRTRQYHRLSVLPTNFVATFRFWMWLLRYRFWLLSLIAKWNFYRKWYFYKSSSGDEIPESDVMYHLLCLLIYHWTTTDLYGLLPEYF